MSAERVPHAVDFSVQAKLFRGLADPARLALILQLRAGARPAGELARACGLSPSNASNHLRCLLECGLVRIEPLGRRNVYRLADPAIVTLLDASERVLDSVEPLIEACCGYGPPSRRALRACDSGGGSGVTSGGRVESADARSSGRAVSPATAR